MVKITPDAQRLIDAREAASKELNLPVTDWRVRRYALLMNAHDNLTARLLASAGEGFDVDALLKLDNAMQEIRATLPPEQIKVAVKFVEGISGVCPKCRAEIPEGEYTPRPPAPRAIDAEAVETVEGVKALPAPKTKPVPALSPEQARAKHRAEFVKDSRPNAPAPAPVDGGEGPLCWVGGRGTFNPFGVER